MSSANFPFSQTVICCGSFSARNFTSNSGEEKHLKVRSNTQDIRSKSDISIAQFIKIEVETEDTAEFAHRSIDNIRAVTGNGSFGYLLRSREHLVIHTEQFAIVSVVESRLARLTVDDGT